MTISHRLRIKNAYYCVVRFFPLRLLWCDLDLSIFPRGTFFAHPYGVTINTMATFGRKCLIRQNVTLGYRWKTDGSERSAVVGDRVRFEAGCIVLGPVTIGSDAVIGAGAVVLCDVPPRCIAVGNPARIIPRKL